MAPDITKYHQNLYKSLYVHKYFIYQMRRQLWNLFWIKGFFLDWSIFTFLQCLPFSHFSVIGAPSWFLKAYIQWVGPGHYQTPPKPLHVTTCIYISYIKWNNNYGIDLVFLDIFLQQNFWCDKRCSSWIKPLSENDLIRNSLSNLIF